MLYECDSSIRKARAEISKLSNDLSQKIEENRILTETLKNSLDGVANDHNDFKNNINGVANDYNNFKNNMNGIANDHNNSKNNMNGVTNDYNNFKNSINGVTNDYNNFKNSINGNIQGVLSEVRNVTGRRCHLYPPILKKKTVLLISS